MLGGRVGWPGECFDVLLDGDDFVEMFFEAVDWEAGGRVNVAHVAEFMLDGGHGGGACCSMLLGWGWGSGCLLFAFAFGRVQVFLHLCFFVCLFLCGAFGIACVSCFEHVGEAGLEGEHVVAKGVTLFSG